MKIFFDWLYIYCFIYVLLYVSKVNVLNGCLLKNIVYWFSNEVGYGYVYSYLFFKFFYLSYE